MTDESEKLWLDDGDRYGWSLPPKSHWIFRLPIIRNIRAAYYIVMISWWYSVVPGVRSGYDEWVIYAIRRGWC